jgi:AMP-binding enzyme
MLELHHAVPALGAALVTVNVRLSAAEMAGILDHSGASLLVATHEFADRARELAGQLSLPCFIAGGCSSAVGQPLFTGQDVGGWRESGCGASLT